MTDPSTPKHPAIPADLPSDPELSYNPEDSAWLNWTMSLARSEVTSTQEDATVSNQGETAKMKTPGTPLPALPGAAGRFHLRFKIAEGGFGEVWEATQLSLDRTIAVKRLKKQSEKRKKGSTIDDPRMVEYNFRQESLTAAHLEHPNILPVYDLGVDEDGRPLLAMKLVKGRIWRDILPRDFHGMPVHEFLTTHLPILISVAQAVAFAHSQGIIHRDLKPSQVMIGRYGEVLLMDWGLAMAYEPKEGPPAPYLFDRDRNSPLFHPSNPAGTPAYMAPEQTETTTKGLGPWTDVYLLGGILYRLLTGQNPHPHGDTLTTFVSAHNGIVEPPEKAAANREIPRQLAALAMKAMEPVPANRVQSAEAFLTGLQNYLTGADKRRESVELCTEVDSCLEKAGTDYGRLSECLNQLDRSLVLWPDNRPAAAIRQKVLAKYARAARDSRDLKLARVQAERLDAGPIREGLLQEIERLEELQRQQDQRLEEALNQARTDRDRAEEARRRADEMRARSEGLVRFLLGDLHQTLKPIGRLDVIRPVVQKTLEYFDSLHEGETTDTMLHNRAIAYMNIGDVLTDEGKKPEALEAYRKACEIVEQLIVRDPERVEWRLSLADSHDRIGQILYYQAKFQDAHEQHSRALSIRERLAEERPDDTRVRAGIASSRHKLGVLFWRNQELERALEFHQESISEFRALLKRDPENADLRSSLSWCLSTLGNVYRDLNDLEKAVEVTREGLAIREALASEQPANSGRLDDVLWTRSNLALLLLMQAKLEESLELFSRDMKLRRRLSDEDPTNMVRLSSITFPLSLMGETLFMLDRIEAAEETMRECLDITQVLLNRDPTSTYVIGSHARLNFQLAEVLVARGQWKEAEDFVESSLASARQAVEKAPKNAVLRKVLAGALTLRGRMLHHKKQKGEAREFWKEAMDTIAPIRSTGEELDILDITAQIHLLLGEPDSARPLLERLRVRRWISPSMKQIAGESGFEL